MSLPDEKYRAIIKARNFLRDLLNPKTTPRVPKKVRSQAYMVLKHFIAEYELEKLAKRSPRILRKSDE